MSDTLFSPLKIGNITLGHRVVMAPLTRFRANDDATHEPVAEEYYEQRASKGGLIITEATYTSEAAGGQKNAPGLWSDAQIASWKRIVDKIHAKGGYVIAQLRADGRAADPNYLRSKGHTYIAPSDVPIAEGAEKPTPLTKEQIEQFFGFYAQAAKNAVEKAGFDGVELHNANGYLPDQFLDNRANVRNDEYGGSAENRARFSLGVIKALTDAVGQDKVAIRISPYNTFQNMGMADADVLETFGYLTTQLRDRFPNLLYLHVVEPRITGDSDQDTQGRSLQFLRDIWGNKPFFSAGGHTLETAEKVVEKYGGAIVFGRAFVSNPDLPLRLQKGLPLTKYDRATFYTAGPEATQGYIDYPFAAEVTA